MGEGSVASEKWREEGRKGVNLPLLIGPLPPPQDGLANLPLPSNFALPLCPPPPW